MDYDEKSELFYRETGIWPPGRDMPAAMCGGENEEMVRSRAYQSWCKLKAENDRLTEVLKNYGCCKQRIEGIKQNNEL